MSGIYQDVHQAAGEWLSWFGLQHLLCLCVTDLLVIVPIGSDVSSCYNPHIEKQ